MSDRGFPVALEVELASATPSLAFLIYLNFPGGAVRVWTGYGEISYDSETWSGAGELGSIDKIGDSLEATDMGVELSLNYLDDDLRNELVGTDPVGQEGSIYLAKMSGTTVDSAYEIFPGVIDEIRIEDGGNNGGRIIVRLASEAARMNRQTIYNLTDAHQQFLFPGDIGLEFAASMNDPIFWGATPTWVATVRDPRYTPSNIPNEPEPRQWQNF